MLTRLHAVCKSKRPGTNQKYVKCIKQEGRLQANIDCAYYHVLLTIINTADDYTDTAIYHQ